MRETCPLCDGQSLQVLWSSRNMTSISAEQAFLCTTSERGRPEVLCCRDCNHWFSNPNEWPTDLAHEYEVLEDGEYLEMLPIKQRTFARAVNVLVQHMPPPATILEVGAYAGSFLKECKQKGYSVVGIEPSRWGASLGCQSGLDVRQGSAEQLLKDGSLGQFDAVVSWDVLEHVENPRLFIDLMAGHVRPNGLLILSTLDRTNWFAKLTGRRWPWVIPMHLHYFDRKSVIRMAGESGLTLVETRAHVHYTSADYALRRLLRSPQTSKNSSPRNPLKRLVFPVGFGDVRLYVFRLTKASF